MPDIEDIVWLPLLLLLLLLDSDLVEALDLEDLPDSDPDLEPELPRDPPDLVLLPVLDVRPVLEERAVLDENSEMSERLEESSEIEESLVLEVIPDSVDKAVVDLLRLVEVFCSTTASPPPHKGLHTDQR